MAKGDYVTVKSEIGGQLQEDTIKVIGAGGAVATDWNNKTGVLTIQLLGRTGKTQRSTPTPCPRCAPSRRSGVTTTDKRAIEQKILESGVGKTQASTAFGATDFNRFVDRLGMNGLNYIIAEVLARHYPADIFPSDIVVPLWSSNEGGREFGPGIRWIALLRAAMEEVNAVGE